MLRLLDLTAAYGPLEVLQGVSLEVGQGEIVALLGANGAGKSTTLAAVSGLIPFRQGTVLFNQRDITGLPAEKIVGLGLVLVPEGRRIFPGLTVLENLEMGAYLSPATTDLTQRLEHVYSIFPKLHQRKSQKGGTLSGGEQQMLAIARGLMAGPKMLLLDEPSLGLAPIVVDKIFDIILEIRKSGVTVLLVEQNARRSLEISDRGYILETGRVVLQGTGSWLMGNDLVKASYLGT
jgi:branched-chain amino acid transport system ATP-binding protein